jgi:hypothetical protein
MPVRSLIARLERITEYIAGRTLLSRLFPPGSGYFLLSKTACVLHAPYSLLPVGGWMEKPRLQKFTFGFVSGRLAGP